MNEQTPPDLARRLEDALNEDSVQTASDFTFFLSDGIESKSFPFVVDGRATYDRAVTEEKHGNPSVLEYDAVIADLEEKFNDRRHLNWLQQYLDPTLETSDVGDAFSEFSADYGRQCHTCGGRTRVSCSGCHGNGKQRCHSCSNGSVTCNSCSGSGYNNCNGCRGSGTAQVQVNVPYTGVGGQTFYRLEVNNETCPGCGGTGRGALCYGCSSGRKTCSTCGGSAKVTCQGCQGSGHLSCGSCGETGRENFMITFAPFVQDDFVKICHKDQETFDRYAESVPGFLMQSSAQVRDELWFEMDGFDGQYRYEAVARAVIKRNRKSEAVVILGHETEQPYRAPSYLGELLKPTSENISNEDFDALKSYPLGLEVVELIKKRKSDAGVLVSKFDIENILLQEIQSVRTGLVKKLTQGEINSVLILCFVSFSAMFLALFLPSNATAPAVQFFILFLAFSSLYLPWLAWGAQSYFRKQRRKARAIEAIGQEIEIGNEIIVGSALLLMLAQSLAFILAAQFRSAELCMFATGLWDNAGCGFSSYFAAIFFFL